MSNSEAVQPSENSSPSSVSISHPHSTTTAAPASSQSSHNTPAAHPNSYPSSSTSTRSHKKSQASQGGRSSQGLGFVNLRLILVSGKTKDFQFAPTESAGDIAKYVFDNWPEDWSDESVSSADILRLIYQGRFLHGNVTLAALGLPYGKTTVMHLVPRESLPEPNSQDDEKKKKTRNSRCCTCSLI